MALVEIVVRLVVVALLVAYLAARHRRRLLDTPAAPEDPSTWDGHGLDTATLQPRLQSVRRDYLTALHRSPTSPAKASRRVAWVRQMISCLAYFRHGHVHGDTEH